MSERGKASRIRSADLPTPIAINPTCVNLPLSTPQQVLFALDALAKDFNTVLSKQIDATKVGMLIGGGTGVAVGFGPGGVLFGPIGAAIGGTLGTVVGGAIGQFLPSSIKDTINPAEAARAAILNGNYTLAEGHLTEIVKRIDAPGFLGAVQKLLGAKVEGLPAELGAMYLAALALVHHTRSADDLAVRRLREALERVKHNVVLIDLLGSFGDSIDDALLDGIEQVFDDVMKTAFLERYAQRHPDEPWAIAMLAQAYRPRFPAQSASLDRTISEKQADIGWMLDIARLAQSPDDSAARAAKELMADLPLLAADATAVIEHADKGLSPLSEDSQALNGGEKEAAENRAAIQATQAALDKLKQEQARAVTQFEDRRSSAAAEAKRAQEAADELGRLQARLVDARREFSEAESRAPGSPSSVERSTAVRALERELSRRERSREEAEAAERRLAADADSFQQQIATMKEESAEKDKELRATSDHLTRREKDNERLRTRLRTFIDDFLTVAPADCDSAFCDDLLDVYCSNPKLAKRVIGLVLAEQSQIRLKPIRSCSGIGENHLDEGRLAYRVYATLGHTPRRRWLRITKKEHQKRTIEQLRRSA